MGTGNTKHKSKLNKNDMFVKDNLNYSNWMEDMAAYIKDVRLIDLRLINTHHSASYSINNFIFKEISICQDTSLYYQLYGGVRVFDFRPGRFEDGKEIHCGHGPHFGMKLYDCFHIINNFLLEHPKEFVIIKMETSNKFCGVSHELTNEKKFELLTSIHDIFDEKIIGRNEEWFSLGVTTMQDIWEKKKQIMVVSHSFLLNMKKEKKNFCTDSVIKQLENYSNYIWDYKTYYYGRYANTTEADRMKTHVSNYIESSQSEHHHGYNTLYTCELQLTPQSVTSVFKLNAKIHKNEFVQKWFRDLFDNNYRLNIISFDFVFFNPQFVRDIIHSNYNTDRKVSSPIPLKFIKSKDISNTIVIDGDIFKIKLHDDRNKSKGRYLLPDKKNKLTMRRLKSEKIKSFYFQFIIVDENCNSVMIKHCYRSCKNKLINGNDKNCFFNIRFNVNKNEYEFLLTEDAGVFKLNFVDSQTCEIQFLNETTNEILLIASNGKKLFLEKNNKSEEVINRLIDQNEMIEKSMTCGKTKKQKIFRSFYLEK